MNNNNKISPHEFVLLLNDSGAVVFNSTEVPFFCTEYNIDFDFKDFFNSESLANESFLTELKKKIQICQKFNETLSFEVRLNNKKSAGHEYFFEIVSVSGKSKGSLSNIAVFGKKNNKISMPDEMNKYFSLEGYDLILHCDTNNVIQNFSSTNIYLTSARIEIGKTRLQDILASPICNFINTQLNLIDQPHSIIHEEFVWNSKSKRKSIQIRICKFENEYWIELQDASKQTNKDKELRKFVEELHYNKIISEQYAKELTLVNRKLNESQKQLEELNLNKDKFFSIVAHDLRSPFSALLGFSEFLAKEAEDLTIGEIKDYSSSIHTTGRHLLSLLENLLTWSRVQLGRIEIEPQRYDISEQIISLNNYYIHVARQKGIKLNLNLQEETFIFADSNMVETVLRNLITNALKFTPNGGNITIEVSAKQKFCEIKIIDTGVGIPKEYQSKIFKIESHHTTEGTNKEKGSGLGLIICYEFINKNNGILDFESIAGKGTTFSIKLPKSKSGETVKAEKTQNSKSKKTSGYKFSK